MIFAQCDMLTVIVMLGENIVMMVEPILNYFRPSSINYRYILRSLTWDPPSQQGTIKQMHSTQHCYIPAHVQMLRYNLINALLADIEDICTKYPGSVISIVGDFNKLDTTKT